MIYLLFLSFLQLTTVRSNMSFKVEPINGIVCNLGEGPHWDHKSESIYFVDAFVGDVYKFNTSSGETNKYSLKDLVTIVIPFQQNKDILLVSLRNKVIKLDTNTVTHEVMAQIGDQLNSNERFNDGKIDASGRLWIGSVFHGPDGGIVPKKGSLYRLEKNTFVKMSENFTLSNGMTWNQNNTKMYFNDSEDRKIYVFDFDLENGLLFNKTVFVDLKSNSDFSTNEFPDGMTIDKNGKLWVSLYGGGRVVQINERTGKIENSVSVPALLTTSVTFGGKNLDQLFVTTGNDGLSDDDKTQYPNAGKLFRVTTPDKSFGGLRPDPHFIANI